MFFQQAYLDTVFSELIVIIYFTKLDNQWDDSLKMLPYSVTSLSTTKTKTNTLDDNVQCCKCTGDGTTLMYCVAWLWVTILGDN